jgi:hypothetical protein
VLDFNRANLSASTVSIAINELIEQAAVRETEQRRSYLGASIIGSECLRKIQYDWMCDPIHPGRLRDIFARGHFFEEQSRQRLIAAGFRFAPRERLAFNAVGGLLRGHADGIIVGGSALPGIGYPCLWEHKALNAKNWRGIERDGVEKAFPQYFCQVQLYQAYLNVTEYPAIFSVINVDNCVRLHELIAFDAARAQAWSDRAALIIKATRAGELLARFTDDQSDWRCKMCSHRERCWAQA